MNEPECRVPGRTACISGPRTSQTPSTPLPRHGAQQQRRPTVLLGPSPQMGGNLKSTTSNN
ncbi:hypothetical protein D623_10027436 [Myotis brandtii]|uniref:Uncharacterized protein n=1 Tax=Myotis brandtii TaxID=109478 RepID=S7MZ72_MYOBR|nr:hypothetical protein D623_10027436 [Myotis brandtii]